MALEYLKKLPEGPLIDQLAKAFNSQAVQFTPVVVRRIIDFGQMLQQCLVYKERKSKREVENDLASRIAKIKKMSEQMKWDKDRSYAEMDEAIKNLLFAALIEKGGLIYEHFNKKDFRDNQALDFHLWIFREILKEQKIQKPVDTLALILEKSGVLAQLNDDWKAKTIYNKCSNVQALINQSGACHPAERVGNWPNIRSPVFIKDISGKCSKCYEAWTKILLEGADEVAPIDHAIKELQEELPECHSAIVEIVKTLRGENEEGMHLSEILRRLPIDLRGVFIHLF